MNKTVIWGFWYRVEFPNSPTLPSKDYLSSIVERIKSWAELDYTNMLKIRAKVSWSLSALLWVEFPELLDLRGIDLSGINIGQLDLSYSCFDCASFENSRLEYTWLQFSCWQGINFNRAELINLQASPMFMINPSFLDTVVEDSFFDNSTIIEPKVNGLLIKNSEWLSRSLNMSV